MTKRIARASPAAWLDSHAGNLPSFDLTGTREFTDSRSSLAGYV